jgi:Mg2+ and Co2+ transporters
MTRIFTTKDGCVREILAQEEGCWIAMVKPDEHEISSLAERYAIDPDLLRAALDTDERSRIETDDNCTMVLVNIPTVKEHDEKELYDTIPLSILVTKEAVITVCLESTPVLQAFADGKVKNFYTNMKTRFIFQVLYRAASLFLQDLRIVDKKSDMVENQLHRSTQNRELIELLKLEKSLVYFTTALRSNEVVLEKLLKTDSVKKYPEDDELLEDTIVENKQAIEMANIYSGILSGMMDAFASVISNNLNIVMKVLAVVTIVLSVPTLIFSAYGMNVNMAGMPFAQSPWGFWIIVVLSLALSAGVAMMFAKTKRFR